MIAYEGRENYIFISYAHKDSDRVIPIIEALDKEGFRIWYDSGIEAGAEWPEYIEDHLLKSSRVLVFMTPSCVASQNCRSEINLARQEKKEMLIVYLEPTKLVKGMSLQLNSVQAINADLHPSTQDLIDTLVCVQLLQCCKIGWDGKDEVSEKTTPSKKSNFTKSAQHSENAETASLISAPRSPLLKRAFIFLEDGEWDKANEYCEKELDQNPECAEAYLGKLMVELHVKKRDDFKDLKSPFSEYNNFKKAIRFGNDQLKSELNGYIEAIKLQQLEDYYTKAKGLMDTAKTESAYKSVAGKFKEISEYKDSEALYAACLKKAAAAKRAEELQRLEALYTQAKNEMNAASTAVAYITAAKKFEEISKYKDSKELCAVCLKKAEDERRAAELQRLERVYIQAKNQMNAASTEAAYKTASKLFETISEYKDSKELYTACLEKAEAARKNEILFSAKSNMHLASYNEAIRLFASIEGWKDADEQCRICREKIEEIQIKAEAEARAEADRKAWEEAREKAKVARLERERIAAIERTEAKGRKKRLIVNIVCILFVIIAMVKIGDWGISFGIDADNLIPIILIICAAKIIKRINKLSYKRINRGAEYKLSKMSFCIKDDILVPDIYKKRPVTHIGKKAFKKCSKITSVTISHGIKSIDEEAFNHCTKLEEITIPNSVTSIKYRGLGSCWNLRKINYQGTLEQWNAIDKESYWDSCSDDYIVYCTDGVIPKKPKDSK